jgi:regulator of sigma E protease
MNVAIKIFSFLLTIFIVVMVHEFCHFWMARRCGVKVKRFSIGFGKPLVTWYGRDGTEYVLAPIPLGGYVKMLDSREEKLKKKDLKFAFDHKSILARAAIILAGPVSNVLFALLVFWLMFFIGVKFVKPVIGEIKPHSQAALVKLQPGDEIITVNGHSAKNWPDVYLSLLSGFGSSSRVALEIKRSQHILASLFSMDTVWLNKDLYNVDLLDGLGITPYSPTLPAIIGAVSKNSPADFAGLKSGDKVLEVNGKRVQTWGSFVSEVEKFPEQKIDLKIRRLDVNLNLSPRTDSHYGRDWQKLGFLGVQSQKVNWPPDLIVEQKYSFLSAWTYAAGEVKNFLYFNYMVLAKLVTGKISFHVIGGPIMLFQVNAQAFQQGLVMYLRFLGILSATLAFFNLLPIPGLDGGLLLFLVPELISRRPVSVRYQLLFYRLGLIVLLLLMVQAFINDIMRVVHNIL